MGYKLVGHCRRGRTRVLRVLVNSDVESSYLADMKAYESVMQSWESIPARERGVVPVEPEDPRIFEEFQWGMDVPLKVVRRETRLLLDEKYGQSQEEFPGVGVDL